MSNRPRMHVVQEGTEALQSGMARVRRDYHLPERFPDEVEAAAEHAAKNPRLPDEDCTDIELITIDPPSSMDLDQAMLVERRGKGFRVHYAIADVAAWVRAGDAIDIEANRRGETLYGAAAKISLYPEVLSQGKASLLPDQTCPALLWTIDLDGDGAQSDVQVRRAMVRSRAKLNYAGVQQEIDAGKAGPMWDVLREIGELRIARAKQRGAISLALPEQEISVKDGRWQLEFRARRPVELWNEQISLLTGMAAASLMVGAKVGLLRTLPEPPDWAVEKLHHCARALDIEWPAGQQYPEFISSLQGDNPLHIAMLLSSTSVLRGAGYTPFNGKVPRESEHSALAAQYAHTTAPLRRLVDRYVGETCLAICAGREVPEWVLGALPGLPSTMRESGRNASRYERAALTLAEALTLAPRVGDTFDGGIIDVDRENDRQGDVLIREPAVEGKITSGQKLPLGEKVKARLVKADPDHRDIRFELVD